MVDSWSLSIDFGTSNTVAAVREGKAPPHTVRLGERGDLLPSAVCYIDGQLIVGAAAVRSAAFAPEGFESSPKTLLGRDSTRLGDADVDTVDLTAAVLREVLAKAHARGNRSFDTVVLTHPEGWGRQRRDRLRRAALAAGIPDSALTLLVEAQAAAQYYTHERTDLPVGARIGVFDFGAGTCDVALLERTPTGFRVVDSDAAIDLGGDNFDEAITEWLSTQYDDPGVLERLDTTDRLALADRIREAKEDLSSTPRTRIPVPGAGFKVLTREEYDRLIAADVGRAVDLARRVLSSGGTDPRSVTLYLTGGSSLTPLVHTELAELTRIGHLSVDPKTVVATGALHFSADADAASTATSVPQPPRERSAPESEREQPVRSTPPTPLAPPRPARSGRGVGVAVAAVFAVIAGVGVLLGTGLIGGSTSGAPTNAHTPIATTSTSPGTTVPIPADFTQCGTITYPTGTNGSTTFPAGTSGRVAFQGTAAMLGEWATCSYFDSIVQQFLDAAAHSTSLTTTVDGWTCSHSTPAIARDQGILSMCTRGSSNKIQVFTG